MYCESHGEKRRRVSLTLHFDPDELTITDTPYGLRVALRDFKSGGVPGTPALPRTQVRIAVPAGMWPEDLSIDDEVWHTVVEDAAFIAPAQPLQPGATDEERIHCSADCDCRTAHRRPRSPVSPGLPAPAFVPPDLERYQAHAEQATPPATAVRIETIGTHHVAVVDLAPVRFDSKGRLEMVTVLRLSVGYAAEPPVGDRESAMRSLAVRLRRDVDPERVVRRPEPTVLGIGEAEDWHSLARDTVLNADLIADLRWRGPWLDLPAEYLVITDDHMWDAATISQTGSAAGLVAAFQRLVVAKRARGITAKVVTITDIVNGRYGDVRSDARDLQEVIRNFLKLVRPKWGVRWLLLGGDVSVVPVRQVAGSMLGYVSPGSDKDPADNTSYWTGTYLKVHAVSLGVWWSASTDNVLVRPDTGTVIPYDTAGTSGSGLPGWYFTGSDYKTRSAVPTEYVRVNGPASLVNATLQFLYHWNQLPTDMYYSSLSSWVVAEHEIGFGPFQFQVPYVYVPEHDWDAVGNGIYGQHHQDGTDLDGVVTQLDLSVGRAPVETATEANTFVDKVLNYEGAGGGSWLRSAREWPTRMVVASSNWSGSWWDWPTAANPPTDGTFTTVGGQALIKTRSGETPDPSVHELVAHISDSDRRVILFKQDANPANTGWYFARSASDLSVSELHISLPWLADIHLPMPTAWIVVQGPAIEVSPTAYQFDGRGEDGSMADQERLVGQIRTDLPAIDSFQRLYEDEQDLSFWAWLTGPLEYLTSARLRDALNGAPHLVSLSGHGNSGGCCGGSVWLASTLTNGPRAFIAYADSCLTNQFDTSDAFSEALLTNPNGGAVGYVGNTRFSWIGVGDDFQRAFFHRLASTRHLGLLNDRRLTVLGTTGYWSGYEHWAMFTLNLLGDPELQVYRTPLPGLQIRLDHDLARILVSQEPVPHPVPSPHPQPPGSAPVLVHVSDGVHEYDAYVGDAGSVTLPDDLAGATSLEITASGADVQTTHVVIDQAVGS